jgi:hypothetical protein
VPEIPYSGTLYPIRYNVALQKFCGYNICSRKTPIYYGQGSEDLSALQIVCDIWVVGIKRLYMLSDKLYSY